MCVCVSDKYGPISIAPASGCCLIETAQGDPMFPHAVPERVPILKRITGPQVSVYKPGAVVVANAPYRSQALLMHKYGRREFLTMWCWKRACRKV